MLPLELRLPYKERMLTGYKNRLASAHFQVTFIQKNISGNRFLIVVPKSVVRKSTARHRIKRLVSQTIQNTPLLPHVKIDTVLRLMRPFTDRPTLSEVQKELTVLFQGQKWI